MEIKAILYDEIIIYEKNKNPKVSIIEKLFNII